MSSKPTGDVSGVSGDIISKESWIAISEQNTVSPNQRVKVSVRYPFWLNAVLVAAAILLLVVISELGDGLVFDGQAIITEPAK